MREAAIADGIQSLSPVVSPFPSLLYPSLWRLFAGTARRRLNYGSSVSVTPRWPIGVDESIVLPDTPIGLGYHLGFSNSPPVSFQRASSNCLGISSQLAASSIILVPREVHSPGALSRFFPCNSLISLPLRGVHVSPPSLFLLPAS